MKKRLIIFSVVFVALTSFVYCASSTTTTKRVKFKNQGIVINQGQTNITNEKIRVNIANSNAGFYNQDFNANNQNINISDNGMEISNTNPNFSNQEFQNQNINYNNRGQINNSDVSISNSRNINNQNGRFNNKNINFSGNNRLNNHGGGFWNNSGGIADSGKYIGNQGGIGSSGMNNIVSNKNIGEADIVISNKNYDRSNIEKYQNVDWSTWKSNFVNRFLDDSLYISSLDFYGIGTWFYYSFDVNNRGEISDIKVFSFYLSEDDKQKIRELIQSYQYQPITIFPPDTKREKAKVKAIVLLGDNETKSRPSDFNDHERIKIQY